MEWECKILDMKLLNNKFTLAVIGTIIGGVVTWLVIGMLTSYKDREANIDSIPNVKQKVENLEQFHISNKAEIAEARKSLQQQIDTLRDKSLTTNGNFNEFLETYKQDQKMNRIILIEICKTQKELSKLIPILDNLKTVNNNQTSNNLK